MQPSFEAAPVSAVAALFSGCFSLGTRSERRILKFLAREIPTYFSLGAIRGDLWARA
jgi:hypothetical protein